MYVRSLNHSATVTFKIPKNILQNLLVLTYSTLFLWKHRHWPQEWFLRLLMNPKTSFLSRHWLRKRHQITFEHQLSVGTVCLATYICLIRAIKCSGGRTHNITVLIPNYPHMEMVSKKHRHLYYKFKNKHCRISTGNTKKKKTYIHLSIDESLNDDDLCSLVILQNFTWKAMADPRVEPHQGPR